MHSTPKPRQIDTKRNRMKIKIEIFDQEEEEDLEEFQDRINEFLESPGISYVDLKICTERTGSYDYSKYVLIYNEIETPRVAKGKKCP